MLCVHTVASRYPGYQDRATSGIPWDEGLDPGSMDTPDTSYPDIMDLLILGMVDTWDMGIM